MDDHDLMRINADTSFTYDARGRMLRTNEPREQERRPAPRLFLGRTNGGYVTRFGAAVPDAVAHQVAGILDHHPVDDGLQFRPATLAAVRETLSMPVQAAHHRGAPPGLGDIQVPGQGATDQHVPVSVEEGGPTYRFPASVARPGEAVQLTDANVEAARDTYPWLLDELADWWPCFAVLRDGAAVSVCFSSRRGDGAAAAGVDTLPAFRGHGYAATVTAAWGAAIRASGRIPLYSTTWSNQASQGVARRAGLIAFGAYATWT